jgi:hypothetical protein
VSSTATAREIRALVDELRRAVADLADPITRKVLRDDGSTTTHTAPSLLAQLQDAVGNSGGRGGVARKGAPLPISPEATDLLAELSYGAAAMHYNALQHDHADAAVHVRSTANIAARWTDWNALAQVVQQLQLWAHAIRALLDPPQRLHIAAPCPRCGERVVWRESGGELVQVPVLQIDSENGCVCLACNHQWPPGKLGHLKLSMAVMGTDLPRPRLRSSAEGNGGRWTETCGACTRFTAVDRDAHCCLPPGHQPADVHRDEILGEWAEDKMMTFHPEAS